LSAHLGRLARMYVNRTVMYSFIWGEIISYVFGVAVLLLRTFFCGDNLCVEILSAALIRPSDSNSYCKNFLVDKRTFSPLYLPFNSCLHFLTVRIIRTKYENKCVGSTPCS